MLSKKLSLILSTAVITFLTNSSYPAIAEIMPTPNPSQKDTGVPANKKRADDSWITHKEPTYAQQAAEKKRAERDAELQAISNKAKKQREEIKTAEPEKKSAETTSAKQPTAQTPSSKASVEPKHQLTLQERIKLHIQKKQEPHLHNEGVNKKPPKTQTSTETSPTTNAPAIAKKEAEGAVPQTVAPKLTTLPEVKADNSSPSTGSVPPPPPAPSSPTGTRTGTGAGERPALSSSLQAEIQKGFKLKPIPSK